MNLGGGRKKAEVKITGNVYTVRKGCSNAKNVSRKAIESYPHPMSIDLEDKLHLSGGALDLLICTHLAECFVLR